ncbi:MAG: T9SS type A sorting domain-containing protein [Saprospiraceae bacterium]|nr:T9SS type A sorting domain-containing protein [Saprospiraceae bacterium]
MKKFYLILSVLLFSSAIFGQTVTSAELYACKLGTNGIVIAYNSADNCNAAGNFAGQNTFGFHSGCGTGTAAWTTVIDWNAATALQASRLDDTDVFVVAIPDITTYYNVTTIDNIGLVFNQGATVPDAAWDKKGEGIKDDGSCGDLFIIGVPSLPVCSNSVKDLSISLAINVFPNPISASSTVTFNKINSDTYVVNLVNAMGQVVRTYNNITGNSFEIEKGDLATGMYFLNFRNSEGDFATKKLIVE